MLLLDRLTVRPEKRRLDGLAMIVPDIGDTGIAVLVQDGFSVGAEVGSLRLTHYERRSDG